MKDLSVHLFEFIYYQSDTSLESHRPQHPLTSMVSEHEYPFASVSVEEIVSLISISPENNIIHNTYVELDRDRISCGIRLVLLLDLLPLATVERFQLKGRRSKRTKRRERWLSGNWKMSFKSLG